MIKMIAVDMDGTFLDENGQYDIERFEKILEELEKREILFVVATGNQISRMRHIFGEQSDRLAYVVGNGSHVIVKNETKILKNLSEKQLSICLLTMNIILMTIMLLFHRQSILI